MDDAGGESRRQRLGEPRVAVAERVHGDAGERVEVLAAVLVPEPDTFAADEGDVLPRVRAHEVGHQHSQSKTAAPAAVRKILADFAQGRRCRPLSSWGVRTRMQGK